MLVKAITVRNFRCAKSGVLNCQNLTAIVGANGAGKSTFLSALGLFYDTNPKIDYRDWYNEDQREPIEISVTFTDLGDAETKRFASYLANNELTVERVFSATEGKVQNRYYGARRGVAPFQAVRTASGAATIRKEYQQLLDSGAYEGLPAYSTKDEAMDALTNWEQGHPGDCLPNRDEGQFFGFTGVAQGYLGAFTKLIYVAAVRDATLDADEGKDSPVKQIIDMVVRNSLAAHAKIVELKAETKRKYDEIVDPKNLGELQKLQQELNRTLGAFVMDAKVELNWLPSTDIQLALPRTDVSLLEDGYPCTVSRSGHGLQRAFILTMLQHLAVASPSGEITATSVASAASAPVAEAREEPDLILCIEEPEVYQHPNRQRHFASVLHKLANGKIEGVARKTQVIYTTHSPMFVGLDRFDQVRLFRKTVAEKGKPKCTKVSEATMDQIAQQLWELCGQPDPKFTSATLMPRLQSVMTPWVNEGFFADVAVLVEGVDDLAVIQGAAHARDLSLEELGISVIPCGGKENLDRPALIFKALDIPIYVIWDSDIGDKDGVPANRRLLQLAGEPEEEYPHAIKTTFACFQSDLEKTLREELGEQFFDKTSRAIALEFGAPSPKDCLKRPSLFTELIRRANAEGIESQSVSSILDTVLALREKQRLPSEPLESLSSPASANPIRSGRQ